MKHASSCHGIAALWVLIFIVVIVGIVGLALDVAYIHLVGQQLQNAADAAALAGGQYVRVDTLSLAREQASYVGSANAAAQAPVSLQLNEANLPDGQIIIGRYHRATRSFVPTVQGADAIKVITSRPDPGSGRLDLLFGPIFGTDSVQLAREAVAFNFGDGNGIALLVLDPDAGRAFRLDGNPILNVPDGVVQVNSTDPQAVVSAGNPSLQVSDVYVARDYDQGESPLGSNTNFDGNLWDGGDGAVPAADPLRPLQTAVADMLTSYPLSSRPPLYVPSGGAVTIAPGYYPDGISWNAGNLTLQPGMYILGGDGLQVTGGNFYADGVFLYVTGGKKTMIKLTGNGIMRISPTPLNSGTPYAGVAIYQDVNTTTSSVINGTFRTNITGTLYFPGAELGLSGTSDAVYGNQVIANTVRLSGNSVINIMYDGRFAGPSRAFLVK